MRFTGGLPETACGWGSTLEATAWLRSELPGLLHELGARVLLDVPCGDLNWMSRVDLGRIRYIGGDVSAANLETARARRPDLDVRRIDVLNDPLPEADTVLCRDFLQHLPSRLVLEVLARLRTTGAAWLLATSHMVAVNHDITEIGQFRPLNLTPLLGPPRVGLSDCEGRILGAWALC